MDLNLSKQFQCINSSPVKYQRYCHWSGRELMDLASGIQEYGFADPRKLSTVIKTKSPTQVKVYIKHRINEIRKTQKDLKKETTDKKVKTSRNVTTIEDANDWRAVYKWKKIVESQRPLSAAKKDYSRIIIRNLCEKFYDEAEETTDPQVMNVKAIYKFMLECVSGEVPRELPIKESAYILGLLRFMKDIFQKCDFQEESYFIQDFMKPAEFLPFQTKDEFKKNEDCAPGTVPVPIDLFENLVCHRQVVDSFNPLGVPVWLLEKEQKYVQESLRTPEVNVQPSTSEKKKE